MSDVTRPRGHGMRRVGTVVSNRMDRSVVVRVDRTVKDPLYKRYGRRTSKLMAHDENNACKIGDVVEVVECRPLSARKRWRVRRVLGRVVGKAAEEGVTA